MAQGKLPSFDRPPVIETVLGVQFQPLPELTNAHLGVFWRRLGPDWPNVSDAPPLDPAFEQFDEKRAWGGPILQLKLTQEPAGRLRIRNATEDQMLQVQNGRLHYNWLGKDGGEYPRYKNTIRPGFDKALATLKEFLAEESIGELKLNQWEVTYVNHLLKGTVWNEPADWAGLFPSLAAPSAGTRAARLESFGGHWHYEIEPQRGRLHVELQHGRGASPDAPEMLEMKLTARGPIGAGEDEGLNVDQGLNLGHETIVTAFRDLTSPEAHKTWGISNDDT